jgi:signal recognition particle receptor subunit beta
MFINHSSKEVTAKIVFYGPGLSGKTTCLQYIFSVTNPNTRGELISIETEIERTLFFDLLPVNVGLVKGYQTKFQLYTVPGQVFYDSTRKLVLKGADGIVFVADSQKIMEQPNLDSMENLKTNLSSHKQDINEIPMVFQYNKRDLNNIFSIEELNKILNPRDLPSFGSIATKGKGVLEALRSISSLILGKIKHLLDQTEEDLAALPVVDFATNKNYKIIDKEKLPFKKIQTDSFEAVSHRMNPKDAEMKPIDQIKDAEPEEELKVETVEGFNDLEDIMFSQDSMEPESVLDIEEFKIDEQANSDREIKKTNIPKKEAKKINVPNLPEIDEFNEEEEEDDMLGKTVVEADVNKPDFTEIEEIVKEDLEKKKEVEQPEKEEIEIELEQEPFTDLQEVPLGMDDEPMAGEITLGEPSEEENEEIEELEDIGELVTEGNVKKTVQAQKGEKEPVDIKDAEPFTLEETLDEEINLDINETPFHELEEVKEIEHEAPFEELEDVNATRKLKDKKKFEVFGTAKPLKEINEVEELKKVLEKEAENKENKKIPIIPKPPKGMDLFEQLKDKTRVTLIKGVKVKGPDAQILIDIKDGDSNLLESLKVKITPEIKKVTLILDVKK